MSDRPPHLSLVFPEESHTSVGAAAPQLAQPSTGVGSSLARAMFEMSIQILRRSHAGRLAL